MTDHPHDALLVHRDFLLRLARSLVRDESTAEDVVQDASAAYLAAPPESRDSSRAWLARVVRRLAARTHRSSARTRAREAAVARPDWEPSGIEETDRQLDAQANLIDHLKALPDTQREVVKLRYHDDMVPQAIAGLLDLPVSTVHTRLHRALASLRESMDRTTGGDRSRWMSALLPSSAGLLGRTVQLESMRTTATYAPWVAAAASVALLTGLYLALHSAQDRKPPTVTVAVVADGKGRDVAALPGSSSGTRVPARPEGPAVPGVSEPEGPDHWLIPIVATGGGVAVKSTQLHVAGVNGSNWGSESELVVSMEAPGTGVFDLRHLLERYRYQFSTPLTGVVLRVEHPDCPSQTITVAIPAVLDRETAPAEPISIAFDLPLGSVVTGQVTLADPAAAASTRVFAFPMAENGPSPTPLPVPHVGKETVDENGHFRLRMIHDGPIAVVVIANDHRPETRVVSVSRGGTVALSPVELAAGLQVQGRLTWVGEPVSEGTRLELRTTTGEDRWALYFDDGLKPWSLMWDAGRFEVARVYVQVDADGRFEAAGFGNRAIQVYLNSLVPWGTFSPMPLARSVDLPADLALELEGAIIEVRFEFDEAQPPSGVVRATLSSDSEFAYDRSAANRVADGAPVRFVVPPGREVELTTSFDGFAPVTAIHTAPADSGEMSSVTIRLSQPLQRGELVARLSIDGHALKDGLPVQLEAMPCGSTDWNELVSRNVEVSGGLARFSELPTGCFEVSVYPGQSQQWRSTLRVDARFETTFKPQQTVDVTYELAAGGKALFTARAADGRLVAMQFHVRILDESGTSLPSQFRTAKPGVNAIYGGWTANGDAERHSNLPVGLYTLELRHPEFAPVDQVFSIASDEVTRVDVELLPAE